MFGLVGGGPFFLTGTLLATPAGGAQYEPMSARHDVFAMPAGKLATWSDLLAQQDPGLGDALPLGEQGGTIGVVRDAVGLPVAGAVVVSTNDGSSTETRYLGADGDSFNSSMTASSGLFVIRKPSVAEQFTVEGRPGTTGVAASAKGVIVVMPLDLQ